MYVNSERPIGNFILLNPEEETRKEKGSCFSVSTKDDGCFSVSSHDGECFFIKYDEDEEKPIEDIVDLSEFGFTKLYAIHSSSVDSLYVVGDWIDPDDNISKFVASHIIFEPAIIDGVKGGIHKIKSISWITLLSEENIGFDLSSEDVFCLDAYDNIFSGYMSIRYYGSPGYYHGILFIDSTIGNIGYHYEPTYEGNRTQWIDRDLVRYPKNDGYPNGINYLEGMNPSTGSISTSDMIGRAWIDGTSSDKEPVGRAFEDIDLVVGVSSHTYTIENITILSGGGWAVYKGTNTNIVEYFGYEKIGRTSQLIAFDYGGAPYVAKISTLHTEGTSLVKNGDGVDWTLNGSVVMEIIDDVNIIQTVVK